MRIGQKRWTWPIKIFFAEKNKGRSVRGPFIAIPNASEMRIQLQVKRGKRQACPDFVPLKQQTDSRQTFRTNKIPVRNGELKFLTVVQRQDSSSSKTLETSAFLIREHR